QYIRRCRSERDWRKVLEWIVGILRVEARIDDIARTCDQDGVAVRRRLRDLRHADIAARAGVVFDIKLLFQRLRKLLRDEARHDIGWPGRREGHDDFDRVIGIAG